MEKITRIIATNIRKYREQAGLSQEGLAERADLHRNHIGMAERGSTKITVVCLEKIATALGLNIVDLITDEEE